MCGSPWPASVPENALVPKRTGDECKHGKSRPVPTGLAAAVSSELDTGWWAPTVEEVLTRLPDEPPGKITDAPIPRIQPAVRGSDRDSAHQPSLEPRTTGLRARLVAVDALAVGGTWLVLGTTNMPATTEGRQWVAAIAATVVTLVTMQVLRLYRSRLCVRRGQEIARIVVAVAAGAFALELLRGDGSPRVTRWPSSPPGLVVLALITLRWMFGSGCERSGPWDATAEGSS